MNSLGVDIVSGTDSHYIVQSFKIFLSIDNRSGVIAKDSEQVGYFDVNRRRLQARLIKWINDDSFRGKGLADTFVRQDHNEAHYLMQPPERPASYPTGISTWFRIGTLYNGFAGVVQR